MPGLDPGIHESKTIFSTRMDCRVKPGNDREDQFSLARLLSTTTFP